MRTSGLTACWGDSLSAKLDVPASTAFQQISVGTDMFPDLRPPDGHYLEMSLVGDDAPCAIREDHKLVCWGFIARQPL